jgi:capsular polysaccharide biosynthesis protein
MASTANILTRLVRLWWLTALLAVLGALAGLGYALLTPPTYVARAYVIVVASEPAESPAAVSYAQAYTRIVPQAGVINAAASEEGIPAAELRRNVRAAASPDAPVIEITGSSDTAGRAADYANSVSGALVTKATEQTSTTRMKLTAISSASPPAAPDSPRPVLNVAIGAAVGILLGGLAVLTGTDRAPKRTDRARPDGGGPAETAGALTADDAPTLELQIPQRSLDGARAPAAGTAHPIGPVQPGGSGLPGGQGRPGASEQAGKLRQSNVPGRPGGSEQAGASERPNGLWRPGGAGQPGGTGSAPTQ